MTPHFDLRPNLRHIALIASLQGCAEKAAPPRLPLTPGAAVVRGPNLVSSFPWSDQLVTEDEKSAERIDAYLLPSGNCLVRVIPAGFWFESMVLVIELKRQDDGWGLVRYRLGLRSDVVSSDENGVVIPWLEHVVGAVTVNAEHAGRARVTCLVSLKYVDQRDQQYTVEGSFEVVPQETPGQLPFELDRYMIDANAAGK